MSSAEERFSGIGGLERPTSKVLAPPGGKTSINLFGGADPVDKSPAKPRSPMSNVFGGGEVEPSKASPKSKPAYNPIIDTSEGKKENGTDAKHKDYKINAPFAGDNDPVESGGPQRKQPPGGKSSFSFS